jgi:ADP-dependent NAD(P)H-hydrate dehydratase / NAD(P)H-hydrate epimerase
MAAELLTPAEMYRADALAIAAGTPEDVLIKRAGLAVAAEIVRRYGARKTVVLCGPGNNGKDGRAAAQHLMDWGWPVEIGDDVSDAELILDALFGAGLNRSFPEDVAQRVRQQRVPVVAIDVPSGLDGLTGLPRGACIKADLTITFVRKKPGHLLYPGRGLCGEVVVTDIGIGADVIASVRPRYAENRKPSRAACPPETHKFLKGHAIVFSGGEFSTGAARLAAQAALKIGAGLVSIAAPASALRVHANQVTAVMLKPVKTVSEWTTLLEDQRIKACCIGPAAGVGVKTRKFVLSALASRAAVVLDADAITSFETEPTSLFKAIKARANGTVLTPHEGEFARLFPDLDEKRDKLWRACTAAQRSNAIVILKGPDTVIAHPDGRAVINSNGTQKLATAGSGDVLAGIVTGLLAEGMMDAFSATCAAVWLHAAAAEGCRNPTAEDLVAAL